MVSGEKTVFTQPFALPPVVKEVLESIARAGGWGLLVGGAVRDLVLGLHSKDLDFEVHRLKPEALEELLGRFGSVDLVGRQFGVYRIHGIDADWSVPRIDSKGRHPKVETDPWMGLETAARRRDLTINALAYDPLEMLLYDPVGGRKDLERGILRAPDPKRFPEDPLRFFRVMAFIGRFNMTPDEPLSALCATMELSDIARERIGEEFNRLWLRSAAPSLGLRWIDSIGRLNDVLPEAAPLKGLNQDPIWHPEGDVWQHTLQVIDAASALKTGDEEQDLMLLWAALCHDLGKVKTTAMIDNRLRSPGHCEISGTLAEKMLGRIVGAQKVIQGAAKLSVHHLKPHDFFVNKAGPKAFKRLALTLSPETTLERLAALALADHRGRNPNGNSPLKDPSPKSEWFLEQAVQLEVEQAPEPPALKGRHLLDRITPGPEMGKLLRKAYEIQLAEGIRDPDLLKARVLDS